MIEVHMFFVGLQIPENEEDAVLECAAAGGTTGLDRLDALLRVWFRSEEEARRFAGLFADRDVVVQQVVDSNWNESWQAEWRPVLVGRRWYLAPPWDESAAPPGRLRIALRPGLSFGNGDHPTTQMCLALMEDSVAPGAVFLDAGCGSGILQEAAERLGARLAAGCDLDERAVLEAARYGPVFRGSLDAVADGSIDVLAVNIQLGVLLGLLPDMGRVTRSRVILSGILDSQQEELIEAAAVSLAGWTLLQSAEQDGWVALLFAGNGTHQDLTAGV